MIKLANKQTDEQKQSNNFTRFHFIMAMMNLDLVSVKNLLKKDGKFLGWMNDWQFCNWLDKKFRVISSGSFQSSLKEQVCLDICPGADMLVFEFAKMEDEETDPVLNEIQGKTELVDPGKLIRIQLVLMYENGLIADIRLSEQGCDSKRIKKLQLEN